MACQLSFFDGREGLFFSDVMFKGRFRRRLPGNSPVWEIIRLGRQLKEIG